MEDFEKELQGWFFPAALVDIPENDEDRVEWQSGFTRFLKAKLLMSYRNGQRDCPKCNPKPPRKDGR